MDHEAIAKIGQAAYESIKELVENARQAQKQEDDNLIEEADEAIRNDPLSIEVRTGWAAVGRENVAEEYRILLSWGGPATQITGELGEHNEPMTARLQVQDWGTPWTNYWSDDEEQEETLLEYARCFYYGE